MSVLLLCADCRIFFLKSYEHKVFISIIKTVFAEFVSM